jgi:NAD(P)-dependent dehydrogenase (short-subunit alcohol dehydrogenase family)
MSKVWFITGAGSGIGAGTAKAALKAGDRVVATGRNVQKVRDALREVASDELHVLPLDVSDEAQVTVAVDQAEGAVGASYRTTIRVHRRGAA